MNKTRVKQMTIALLVVILLIAALFIIEQSKFLSLQIFNKKATEIQLVVYEDEPFLSEVIGTYEINDSDVINKIMDRVNMQNVFLWHTQESSMCLFFYFEDGSSVNAIYDDEYFGFDYGYVWIKIDGFEEFLAEFQ